MPYTKLDSGITESTIWHAPDSTLRVWIAMLARADQHGYVGASMPGLAALARVSLDACIQAVATLEAPDEWSRTKDHEGRRIAPADGGWVLLNHAKYRAKQNADDRRERSRIAMAELRARRKQEQQSITVSEVNRSDAKLLQAEAAPEAATATKASASEAPRTPAAGSRDETPLRSTIAPGSSPRTRAAKPAAPTAEAWSAYEQAYSERYGAQPVRNAKVNGMLAQLVSRLGADEAPGVARFYVGHRHALYVSAKHCVDLLVRDCEKLRTEWVTGQQGTATEAKLTDRTQTNLNAFAPLIAEAKAREAKERQDAQ